MILSHDRSSTPSNTPASAHIGDTHTSHQLRFHHRAHANAPEFELGLELDSAEVRGVLIYQGQDWGRVVFNYRT